MYSSCAAPEMEPQRAMAAKARSFASICITSGYATRRQDVFELAALRRSFRLSSDGDRVFRTGCRGRYRRRYDHAQPQARAHPFLVILVGIVATAATASFANDGTRDRLSDVEGTIWVANRGVHTIQGFDARTGGVAGTIAMTPGSQPEISRTREGKYVAEEFASPPAIAIVDPETGVITKRISMAPLSRPHHVHTTRRGNLVAFGLYGTDDVAVVDTRTDTLLGQWDTNGDPAAESGRAHAGVFSTSWANPLCRQRCVERDRHTRSQDGCHPLEPDGTRRAQARRDAERQDRVRRAPDGEPGLRPRPASPRRVHRRAHARASRHAPPCGPATGC